MESTCGNCHQIQFDPSQRFAVAGCLTTGYVIPHHCDYTEKKLTFWRVPTECPRVDDSVKKSEKQAPKKQWVIKSFSDFE